MSRPYHMTADEVEFIRVNRASMSIAALAKTLDRTDRCVSLHIKSLGLARPYISPMTEEQIAYVRENAAVMSQRDIADHLGRSQDAVRRMCKRLGIPRRKVVPNAVTDSERDFITANWQTMTDAEMASQLGRSACAVQNQRQKMGLKREPQRPPVKPTAPGRCRMVRDQTRAARSIDHRPTDSAVKAADYLASFDRTPVFRIDERGQPSAKGKLWRYGTTRLTTDEMMAKAYRKGFDPDAWRRLAA